MSKTKNPRSSKRHRTQRGAKRKSKKQSAMMHGAAGPQPREIPPGIPEEFRTRLKRVLDELASERIEDLLSQARQEHQPDPAAEFEEAKHDAIYQEIWKPFRDRVANHVLAAQERKRQGADLPDLVTDFARAYSGYICQAVTEYAELLAQRSIASGKRITVERHNELVEEAVSLGGSFVDWYMVSPWLEMIIGEIPSKLENRIVEALRGDDLPWRKEAIRQIALRAALSPPPAPRLRPELVPSVRIPLETLERKESILQCEAANALAVRNRSTIRRWARAGKLDRTDAGRIVVNEKFKVLYKQRHSPATRKK